jgi:hypothetical protein
MSPPQWLKKEGNHKINELITLTQAEIFARLYEYVLSRKNVFFKLLAKESDNPSMLGFPSMAKEIKGAVNEKRKVILIVE